MTAAERMRAYREQHRERVREYERERLRRRREAGWKEDPIKKRARNAIAGAIRYGRLSRPPCEVCGDTPAQAHHDDYERPLDVRWLCRLHHERVHGRA